MRMLEPNTTSTNPSILGAPTNNTAHLQNSNAAAGAAAMQTNLVALPGNAANATGTGDRLDASSDSAVSSMGSERVPSLSDGEWGDAGSDSAQEYLQRYSFISTLQ